MPKPKGGRGKKAPYEAQMMRVPVPIKPAIQRLIDDYKEEVFRPESERKNLSLLTEQTEQILTCLKLVNRFIDLIGQTDKLHDPKRRNNVNLARFRDWLESQISQDAP
jgi:hypothetical protein